MSDVVNLNRARKKKRAIDKDAAAAANRAKFGRTKAQKALDKQKDEALRRHVDGHERDED